MEVFAAMFQNVSKVCGPKNHLFPILKFQPCQVDVEWRVPNFELQSV